MDGPRLTEERLRYHLDSNQVMRERLCLALLPLLGPYTREQSRRPKGGPDGGRDIEAVYRGAIPVWGAVGFRNGGGVDAAARAWADEKFTADLNRAIEENPLLVGFVFFTNVDLTPTQKETLVRYAQGKNIKIIDIFDIERLRHVLDSPEGLIARLQYLDIPMSATEQASLVAKFGNELQSAVTARFDRVERTLAQMERFLAFQKPLLRIDAYIELTEPTTTARIGDEAALLVINGLQNLGKTTSFLYVNQVGHRQADKELILFTYVWNEDNPSKILALNPSIGQSPTIMGSYCELSLTAGGQRVRIADLTVLEFEAVCTDGLRNRIKRIAVDANGYELFNYLADGEGEVTALKWAEGLSYDTTAHKWVSLIKKKTRNFIFDPPEPARQFLRLQWI